MNMLMNFVLALQILAALVMIGLVLIQHGKGADMGASFGSGASGSLFGATGSANFLSRSTAACAAVFFVCTLALAYTSNDRPKEAATSVLDRPATPRQRAGADAPRAPAPFPAPRQRRRSLPRAPTAPRRPRRHRPPPRARAPFRRSERLDCSARIRRLPGEPFLMPAEATEFECRRRGEIGRHAILRG